MPARVLDLLVSLSLSLSLCSSLFVLLALTCCWGDVLIQYGKRDDTNMGSLVATTSREGSSSRGGGATVAGTVLSRQGKEVWMEQKKVPCNLVIVYVDKG